MRFRVRFTMAAALALAALSTVASTTQVAFAKPVPDPTHPARHGIVWQRGAVAQNSASISPMSFGGGVSGIGVTTGAPKVYLVFWGSQWGTQSTNSAGNLTFSGDASGMAPDYQAFMKGLGTGSETWSGVMTQYCEGVATGATSCPSSNGSHVGYPTGGAYAGVWYDNSTTAPSQATENQLAQEAFNATGHFGNTTATSNRNAQYVVLSPHNTHPDGYNTLFSNWCAWHDYTSDPALTGGPANGSFGVAFTNLPYIPDTGSSCGANFNNLGALAGVTIVGGHEYAETITDQFPAGGWTDSSGAENGDKCAWISTGSSGASQNITLTTGTFAVQSTYANDGNNGGGACEVSHPIVTNGGTTTNDFSISASPSSQTVTAGQTTPAYTVSTSVVSGTAEVVTLTATGLPSGATATFANNQVTAGSSTTMTIATSSTTPAGSYTVTVTGTAASATHSTTTGLTVNAQPGTNPIVNGGFETGSLSGWTASGTASVSGAVVHSGADSALLGSTGSSSGTSSISQTFTIPSGVTTLTFWFDETCVSTHDYASATLQDKTAGTTTTIWKRNQTGTSGWLQVTYNVSGLAGHSVTLTFNNRARSDSTHTYFDDVSIS